MYLTHLSLTNFRNYSRLDWEIPAGPVLIIGANAQGKTSLLEAIYYLATFTTFHADNDRQLINFLVNRDPLAVTRIAAEYQRGAKKHRIEVRIILEKQDYNGNGRLHKDVLLDGVKRKLNEAYCHFNATMFLPQMLEVVNGAPEVRRRYLNLLLAQVYPGYAANLAVYTRALNQRNALLKQLQESDGAENQLDYWDEQLTLAGAHLIAARIQAVQELECLAMGIHTELSRAREVLRLSYLPAYDPMPLPQSQMALPMDVQVDRSKIPLEQIYHGFLERLGQLRFEEIQRGVTTIGPHRDELRFIVNQDIDLGDYGSRGQARTVMLSLKLAEAAWMKEKTGQAPVLLLDEVLAELDDERRADLLGRLSDGEQTLMTTTDLKLFTKEFVGRATIWYVHGGQIVPHCLDRK